jgi:hypothetical protein
VYRVAAWKGGLPPSRRPGSASSLSVSAARRRPSSKTESQVMNAAVDFSLTSRLRFHFETAPAAFPLDKDSEQIWSKNLQSNESSRDCCRGIVRSGFLFFYFCALREGGTLTLTELSPARLQLACALKDTKGHQDRATWKGNLELSICLSRGIYARV